VSAILAGLVKEDVGADWCVSVGNGAALSVAEATTYAVERPTTEIVCIYMEGVPRGEQARTFIGALDSARAQGKSVVILKAGTSEQGKKIVLSHTASIAGSDDLFSVMCLEHGAIRVSTLDEMIRVCTIVLLGIRQDRRRSVAVLGNSGGVAALSSDLAESTGTSLAQFSEDTANRLEQIADEGSFVGNPLDIISAVPVRGDDSANGIPFQDSNVGFVVMPWSVQFPEDWPELQRHRDTFEELAYLARRHDVPTLISSIGPLNSTRWLQEYRRRNPHIPVVEGLGTTFASLSKLYPSASASMSHDDVGSYGARDEVMSELGSREILSLAGVPLVPAAFGADPEAAATAAQSLTPPFAVKIAANVSHKSAIGGVILGVVDASAVAVAARRIRQAAERHGLAGHQIQGFVVEEMIFGRELLVGLSTDANLGKYLVIGLGGTATELARRTTTRLLPLGDEDDVSAMLAYVGVAEHEQARGFVRKIVDEFCSGSLACYSTVEVNPAIVGEGFCLAADAMVVLDQVEGSRVPSSRNL
jgi:acyl-CoA synthetase (NDP forming)